MTEVLEARNPYGHLTQIPAPDRLYSDPERHSDVTLLETVAGIDVLDFASILDGLGRTVDRLRHSNEEHDQAARQRINAAFELVRRYYDDRLKSGDEAIRQPEQAASLFLRRISYRRREVVSCALLTTRHQLIEIINVFHGTIDGCPAYPREIVTLALRANAAAVILGHNHPSGDPEPSNADVQITKDIATALKTVNVRLIDHVVVAGEKWVSLALRGKIPD
ncbi:unnamed protein product [Cyprideis torosa]|uniref:Uncharacterized protein n=1 Tax=Cyprideis torosa TaxID=163714 RepID=A0A7R8ZRX6_9CRUS|nr:unnamed protein product [Cyprideis torosa]CAG0905635.1 unnamed protein product [Cyprideis torosa]